MRDKKPMVVRVTKTEFELDDGRIFSHPVELDAVPSVEEFLKTMPIAMFSSDIDTVYGQVRAGLEASGTPIGPLDTMIAAHALSLNATLITNNLREFKRVKKLKVLDWS